MTFLIKWNDEDKPRDLTMWASLLSEILDYRIDVSLEIEEYVNNILKNRKEELNDPEFLLIFGLFITAHLIHCGIVKLVETKT